MFDLFETGWEELWADQMGDDPLGAVFTRPEIVDLILDLAEYLPAVQRLARLRVLEPSCGDGAFLERIIRRLLASEKLHQGCIDWRDPTLALSIRAVDLNAASVMLARGLATRLLTEWGCPQTDAEVLATQWIEQGDFLLREWGPSAFDLVVGNPPYVRIESLPRALLALYRNRFATTADRADLYVAFIERGLELISPRGTLAFITANRFAKNLYGRTLRRLITAQFHVRYYLNLEHTQPFRQDVSAYPAILVVDRKQGTPTRAATLDDIGTATLRKVSDSSRLPAAAAPFSEFTSWYSDGGPWLTTCRHEFRSLDAASSLSLLEGSAPGTKVGIGVATGADKVFILPRRQSEIELDRQLPLLLASDIRGGSVSWSGHFLVNPFDPEGKGRLVDLSDYPGLAVHLGAYEAQLRSRHVAKARPQTWYRTIDRIWPEMIALPKLLLPDIQRQDETVVVFDRGEYYPHHNLYWITSTVWDLEALGALLRSSQVRQQVRSLSVQMRGGSIRWQAQTLRKLRIPAYADLSSGVRDELTAAFREGTQSRIDAATEEAFAARAKNPIPHAVNSHG